MTALPDYDEALIQALGSAQRLGETETVQLADAGGRVLCESITADRDLPPFNRAQMDGYALRASEVGRVDAWPVAGTIAAGQPADCRVPPGQCVAIATGAPLPEDVDTVIQHELSDRGNPVRFTVKSIERGHAVHARGADAREGDTLLETGTVLGAQHLGIAAAVGKQALLVSRRPRVIILTSGDEVLPEDADVQSHQIRNSNAIQTNELLRRMGAEPAGHRHVRDELDTTTAAVGEALASCDLLITIGGISAGERDFFPAAFNAHGVEISLHGAAIQPGRPIIVGRTGKGVAVVGLPGNPVSSLACACLFVWPIVRVMLGLDADLPWRTIELAEAIRPNAKRRAFRPAMLVDADHARLPSWAGSGDLVHTAQTDGLLELPVQSDPALAGTRLRILPWP